MCTNPHTFSHTHTQHTLHILFKTKRSWDTQVPFHLCCSPPPTTILIPRASVSSSIYWDLCQLCSGHCRNKCEYPQSTWSPLETRAHQNDSKQSPNHSPVVTESPTPWEKLEEERKINQSDTDEFSRHSITTLLLGRLALQRPPDKNRAEDTSPKESKAHISFCSGLSL